MENISLIQDVGMNIDSCHICNKQKEKLIKIKAIVPNVASADLTIKYEMTIFMCSECLNIASEHINKKGDE